MPLWRVKLHLKPAWFKTENSWTENTGVACSLCHQEAEAEQSWISQVQIQPGQYPKTVSNEKKNRSSLDFLFFSFLSFIFIWDRISCKLNSDSVVKEDHKLTKAGITCHRAGVCWTGGLNPGLLCLLSKNATTCSISLAFLFAVLCIANLLLPCWAAPQF